MTAPLPAGILVYAKDTDRLAGFYRSLLGLAEVHRSEGLVVLRAPGPGFEMVVHGIPAHIASQITVTAPPELREEAALKFFFPVPDLDAAAASALALGGRVFEEQWHGHDFLVRNGHDPEGNIFQLRQASSAAG